MNNTVSIMGRADARAAGLGHMLAELFPYTTVRFSASLAPSQASGVWLELEGSFRWAFVADQRCALEDIAGELSRGSWGVVTMSSDAEEFHAMVTALLKGAPPIVSVSLLRQLAERAAPARSQARELTEPHGTNLLSKRETEVLAVLAEGLSNEEIATRLYISLNTVRTHLHSMSVKLGVASRARILVRAVELGLIGSPDSIWREASH